MKKRSALTDPEGEVREITKEDMPHFKPASEVLPSAFLKQFKPRGRGPKKAPTKEATTIRLSKSVLQTFRAMGPRWQTKLNSVLEEWVREHPSPPKGKV
ncbi:MAG: hypothetical protein RLZZ142_59 [Verrucomicrobiota bacterium]